MQMPLVGSVFNTNNSYAITPIGKQKVEGISFSGPRFEVLQTISDDSPMAVKEVVSKSGLDTNIVRTAINQLVASGYIRKIQ